MGAVALASPAERVIDNCSKCDQFLNEAVLSADMRNGDIEAKRNRRFHLRAAILNAYLAVLWMEDDVNALKTIDTKVSLRASRRHRHRPETSEDRRAAASSDRRRTRDRKREAHYRSVTDGKPAAVIEMGLSVAQALTLNEVQAQRLRLDLRAFARGAWPQVDTAMLRWGLAHGCHLRSPGVRQLSDTFGFFMCNLPPRMIQISAVLRHLAGVDLADKSQEPNG